MQYISSCRFNAFYYPNQIMRLKKILLLAFHLCAMVTGMAQNDSVIINKNSYLKKGFYKTYEEYLHNAPSVTPSFESTWLITKNGTDTVVTGAKYRLADGTKITGAWGFCDGKAVFISKRVSLFKKRFLLAECLGKNPYLLFWHKNIYAFGPPVLALVTATASALAPASFDLFLINASGKPKEASNRQIKKLLEPATELWRRYQSERNISKETIMRYLTELNAR